MPEKRTDHIDEEQEAAVEPVAPQKTAEAPKESPLAPGMALVSRGGKWEEVPAEEAIWYMWGGEM